MSSGDDATPLPLVADCRVLPASAPLRWLAAGWRDLRAAPRVSLSLGLVTTVLSWLIAAAIGTISFYQMFLDFYRPVEAEITPMPNGQETLNADESDQDTLDQDTAGQAQESASSEQEIEREADQNGLESASESESEDRTDNRRD